MAARAGSVNGARDQSSPTLSAARVPWKNGPSMWEQWSYITTVGQPH